MHVLFVCSRNRLRSPTADAVFAMEPVHRSRLAQRFRTHLKRVRVICLDIADDYEFMDPDLVRLLRARVTRHLPPAE